MKIDQNAPSATPLPRAPKGGAAPASGAESAERAKEPAPVPAQVRALSPARDGNDFDAARVAAIREDIRAGRYQVNPERIASGLLASVRDLLDSGGKP